MKKALIGLVVVLTAVVLLFAACGPGEEAAKSYKLGMLGPLTGPAASWYLPMYRGALMAADEINEAGGIVVGGETYMLEIAVVDDRFAPEQSVTGVQKLIFDEKVKYVYGPMGGCPPAIQPIIEDNRVVMFGLTSPKLLSFGSEYPHTFVVVEPSHLWGELGYKWIADNYPEVKRVALITTHDPTGELSASLGKGYVEAAGMEHVAAEFYEAGSMDFGPQFTRILALDPDLIACTPAPASISGLIAKQAREMGYDGLFFNSQAPEAKVLALAGGVENVEGFIGVGSALYDTGTPVQRAFYERFIDTFGEAAWNTTASYGYMYVFMMAQVFEEADSFDTEVVIPSIEQGEFVVLDVRHRFVDTAGYGVPHERCTDEFYIKGIRNGEWEMLDAIPYPF